MAGVLAVLCTVPANCWATHLPAVVRLLSSFLLINISL
jgi:hypothetical protein